MIKFITVLLIACITSLQAQHTISGNFSPADDYSYLIAYHLKPSGQAYIADTSIQDGSFQLNMPENAPKGTYRMVYAVPQDEFYFDILYSGNEDINFNFNIEQGVIFTTSKENILFSTYFNEIHDIEQEIIRLYSLQKENKSQLSKTFKKYHSVQEMYESKSENNMAGHFIKANKSYVPDAYIPVLGFIKKRQELYFKHLDLSNPVLQSSGFLTNKISNYVLTALPLKKLSKTETEAILQSNIDVVANHLDSTSDVFSFNIFQDLWKSISKQQYYETATYLLNNYIKNLPVAVNHQETIKQMETELRLRLGAKAPEITWKKEDKLKKLSELDSSKYYVLVFWSSTCGHCLKEVPALHKEIGQNPNIKVIAIGLESDDEIWKMESAKLSNFEHVIALGKWESKYAKLYDIHQTPTYYILDSDKKIVAKPESDLEVVEFLKGQ